MRIVHLDTGRDWRGGQSQVAALLEGLDRRGHASLLLAPEGPLLERARALGIAVAAWRCRGDADLPATLAARRVTGSFVPDVIHAHTAHAQIAAVAAGAAAHAPVVVSRRVLTPVATGFASRWKYGLPVARYLCVSHAVRDAMRASGIPDDRLALVPSSVNVAELDAVRARVAAGEPKTSLRDLAGAAAGPLIGTAAAMTAEKRGELLVDAVAHAMASVPEAWFVWIGDGPDREGVERRVAGAGIGARTRLLGFRSDAHELIAQLDLFVLASRGEGLGTAVLEAQALGVPVVTTDSRGVRDLVTDGETGRIAADASLGDAFAQALRDRHARERWRDTALVRVRNFDVASMVERTLAEYASVAAERRN